MISKLNKINAIFTNAFIKAGFEINIDAKKSDRPDISDFQINDAFILAKKFKKNPRSIAEDVLKNLDNTFFETITIDGPGFINFKLKNDILIEEINKIKDDLHVGFEKTKNQETIVVDYMGANVAKILHVGHLRPSIIGQAIYNLGKYVGHKMIGDAHLGDWGAPMGMIIAEIFTQHPELKYFDKEYKGSYSEIDFPYTVDELIKNYPIASAKCKEDPEFYKKSQDFLIQLQNHTPGIYDLWKYFRELSVQKYFLKLTDWLNVHMDYWYGESSADEAVNFLIKEFDKKNIFTESDGCKIINITENFKGNKTPPFIMVKSNGTVKYEATDLATIYNRTIEFKPDRIFYVIDKRQEMQMFLVFNAAESTGIYKQDKCEFLGFGTINGDDGLPLKTRAGGAATALGIIEEVETAAAVSFENNKKNLSLTEEEKKDIIYKISLASLKFADLANFRENDYIFTPDKFVKFEGKTGCYVLYTAVRMNSILEKNSIKENSKIIISNEFEKNIVLKMLEYSDIIDQAWEKRGVDGICVYVYELCHLLNIFYTNCQVNNEENEDIKNSRLLLLKIFKNIVNNFAEIIGIYIPNKM